MRNYEPPYTLTTQIVNLIAQISESIGLLSAYRHDLELKLRRINCIKTIQGSLAIEGNTLPESQIIDILDGKTVIAPPKEIQEVKNASLVYENIDLYDPCKQDDLLLAHKTLMNDLIKEAGMYRQGGVGVLSNQKVIHVAPPAKRVPTLMDDLFNWLVNTQDHPLIVSCVFHYEFEFIHPFADGNGRMGRLWQSLILKQYHPSLAYIPVESMVYQHQDEYYAAIANSTEQSNCAPFIQFMLSMLLNTINGCTLQVKHHVSPQVKMLIQKMPDHPISRQKLQIRLALKDRSSFTQRYLKPALNNGFIQMTIPDKPNSKIQQYQLTDKAKLYLKQLNH